MSIYRSGLERWHDWETAPHLWLLLDSQYALSKEHDMIADVAGNELTVSGYTRQSVTAPVTAPVDVWSHGIAYGAANNLLWGGLDPTTIARWLILAYDGADDATSGLLAYWEFGPITSDAYQISLPAWKDPYGVALPGGDANTGLVHTRMNQDT